ncbi:MAG: hypothetical protein H0X37_26645, partial [Herpetosiphonaceae bacterium]|nr:hypothetical protein [Herpetosiphonaceae bacterium]
METQRHANPTPSAPRSPSSDRRRFLLLAALGALVACTPVVTSDHEPAEQADTVPAELPSVAPAVVVPPQVGSSLDETMTDATPTGPPAAGPA